MIRKDEHLQDYPANAQAQKRIERAQRKANEERAHSSLATSQQLVDLKAQVEAQRQVLSPLRNRCLSVDPNDFTPSRTQTITVAYGSPAFHRRFGRRSDLNLPVPGDSPGLRTFADSHLFRRHRDVPNVDERRVIRAASFNPSGLGRIIGLNGEEDLSDVPRGSRYSDITKYQSRSIDPHAITQAAICSGTKRKLNVLPTCNGQEIKDQVLSVERQWADTIRAAGKPLGEDNYDSEPPARSQLPGCGKPFPELPPGHSQGQQGPGSGQFGWQLGGRTTGTDVKTMKVRKRAKSRPLKGWEGALTIWNV